MPLPFYLNMMFYQEAIASVSSSHSEKCGCVICQAAQGDDKAMAMVIQRVMDEEIRSSL